MREAGTRVSLLNARGVVLSLPAYRLAGSLVVRRKRRKYDNILAGYNEPVGDVSMSAAAAAFRSSKMP